MQKEVLKWSEKEQEKIIKLVKEAKKVLNIQSWVITNYFEDGEIQEIQNGNYNNFIESAVSTITMEYEKASISWKPALLLDLRNKHFECVRETVFHELIHCLTQEMYELTLNRFVTMDECRKAVERLTQRFTRIICTVTSTKKNQ